MNYDWNSSQRETQRTRPSQRRVVLPSTSTNLARWTQGFNRSWITEFFRMGNLPPLGLWILRGLTRVVRTIRPGPQPLSTRVLPQRNIVEESEAGEECLVCTERQTLESFPQGSVTPECEHESTICLACLDDSIHAQMESKLMKDLACPLCPALLGYADMNAWAGKEDFER